MKDLIIITDSYPWGFGERNFIESELPFLEKKYHIIIISRIPEKMRDDKIMAKVPKNVEVRHYPTPELRRKNRIIGLLTGFFSMEYLKELIRCLSHNKGIQAFRDMNDFWVYGKDFLYWLRKNHLFNGVENKLFYSYWSNISVLALALQKKKMPFLKFFSRIHGYDLYNERFAGGRQPFKYIMDEYINRIFFISSEGLQYYKKFLIQHSKNLEKYVVARLGVKRPENIIKKRYTEGFLLVSCSSLITIKRVDLIIRALSKIEDHVYWIHFGDGKNEDETRKLANDLLSSKENIQYEIKGYTPNDEVMNFYKNYKVDCFITTSSTEGCPVSIQEAEANSIPIIGTDVGAIKSMIDRNGVLLSNNPTDLEVSRAIVKMSRTTELERKGMEERSYEIWNQNYNLDVNMKILMDNIEMI